MNKLLLRPFSTPTLSRMLLSTEATKGPFNWVNGARSNPVETIKTQGQNEFFVNIEPRTGNVLSEIPKSGEAEVDRAVNAAREAAKQWKQLTGMERGRLLTRAGQLLREKTETLAKLDVIDNGKPIWEARMDMDSVIAAFEYYGGIAPTINGQHIKMPNGSFCYVTREPFGVVAGVGAWNYPLQTCAWKVAPALACGNTFVYKPSQFTPVTAVVLGEILKEAGVPDGVFNVIQGEGDTGELLTKNKNVDKISFTGSVATGTKIMQAGAVGIRPVTLELGGKSPLIIFSDCDLKNAVRGAMMANFFTQGEVCSNGTRVFVQEQIYQEFLTRFVKAAKAMKIGDPFDESTTVGATITGAHAEKVLGFIERAKQEGAKVECGGQRVPLQGDLAGGYYLSPCILTNCNDSMEAVREEIFGSVACVLPFKTEEEVVKRANDTPFGLGAGVFTQNLSLAHRVMSNVDAGTCWINTFNLAPAEAPFGGFKGSGIGRENGTAAIEFYTQTKTVYVEMNDVDCGQLCQTE